MNHVVRRDYWLSAHNKENQLLITTEYFIPGSSDAVGCYIFACY